MEIKQIYIRKEELINQTLTVRGWVKNHRKQKNFGFIDFTDGTSFKTIQIVYTNDITNFDEITSFNIGCSIEVTGILIKSEGAGQDIEIKSNTIKLLGSSTEDYPMQPKRHSNEFLREQAYLRPRTNLFQAGFRIRSVVSFLIHEYLQNNGYVYVNTPIITGSDCEGAGEMFKVTNFDINKPALNKDGSVDYSKDFFGKEAHLTVSGQLQVEPFALAFNKAYTFGPTFRAENSNTKIHGAEFWMIEPEVCFADLNDIMNIQEDILKYVIKNLLVKCSDEMEFLNKFVKKDLLDTLNVVLNNNFAKITHEEAINILLEQKDVVFENTPVQKEDLAKEHERYLADIYFKKPVFIYNWPKDIKAFYMKLNDDNATVKGADLLVPGVGELMGGSERENDYDTLKNRMKDFNISEEELYWYLNLRKYGSVVHSGFGIGFERLIMYLTGIDNIRDVIPYPRTPNNCNF